MRFRADCDNAFAREKTFAKYEKLHLEKGRPD